MRVHVQVKKLGDSAFMVLSQDYPFISLHKMLSVSFEEWTPEYGSVGCVVTRFVKFKTSDLPCNLSSSPIVEYILPPFFLWKLIWQQKMTVPWIGNTVAAYKCTVLCAAIEAIPCMVRVKVLSSHLINLAHTWPDTRCNYPSLSLLINADAIFGMALPL